MKEEALERIVAELRGRPEPAPLVPEGLWRPELGREIERILPASSSAGRLALKSALLLWNDDLSACHAIAQDLKTPTGSYLHGVMHRREPDYGNSKYWFSQFGAHPVFPRVREAALKRLGESSPRLKELAQFAQELRKARAWESFRMVDACEEAARPDAPAEFVGFLRLLQSDEIELLVEFCREGKEG